MHVLPEVIPEWELELLRRQWEEAQEKPPPPPQVVHEAIVPLEGERGWKGAELVDNDGENWPLDFAAKLLQMPEKDMRDLVRIVNNLYPGALEPTGTIKMASFRRQGRHPRAYPGSKLLMLVEGLADLSEELAST
jgi:hypothetical protein